MILALDLGSTNFKAALFSDGLQRLGEASLATPYLHNDGERVEMDVDDVRNAAVKLIHATCKDAGSGAGEINSVAIASQAQNFAVLDGDGNARTPVTSWLDGRAAAEAEKLWAELGTDWHQHCSFPSLTGHMQLAQMSWMHHNTPDVFQGDASVLTLPGLVFHRLTGLNLTDDNLAAMSGTYSLRGHDWRTDVMARWGIAPGSLPRLFPVGFSITVPTAGPDVGLQDAIALVPAGNDQTAGAYGNGCSDGTVVLTLGTALVAYRSAGTRSGPYHPNGCWGPRPNSGHYELAVLREGCLALDWARELLMPGASIAEFDAAVAEAIPWVTEETGTFCPTRMRTPEAWRGKFQSTSMRAYAVLEGITFRLHQLVFEELDISRECVFRAIGGGSHSDVWLQLIADTLDCPITIGAGDSLLGAATMARGALPKVSDNARRFRPTPARQQLLARRLRAEAAVQE